jgi:hypothetical protein
MPMIPGQSYGPPGASGYAPKCHHCFDTGVFQSTLPALGTGAASRDDYVMFTFCSCAKGKEVLDAGRRSIERVRRTVWSVILEDNF